MSGFAAEDNTGRYCVCWQGETKDHGADCYIGKLEAENAELRKRVAELERVCSEPVSAGATIMPDKCIYDSIAAIDVIDNVVNLFKRPLENAPKEEWDRYCAGLTLLSRIAARIYEMGHEARK